MATPFQTYTIHYQSGPGIQAFVQIFNTGAFIGRLNFHSDGTTLPPNSLTGSIFSINYHLSRFRDVLHILQYEKPLQVHIGSDGTGILMATSFEPVGEQEGV
jgi:hypothetical protein